MQNPGREREPRRSDAAFAVARHDSACRTSTSLGDLGSSARRVKERAYTADLAAGSGSSEAVMPSGRTNGSKLISRALPASSVCTAVMVMVPALIDRRDWARVWWRRLSDRPAHRW